MIEAAGLSKFYGDFAAVRNVSFSVPQGQVAAFLGPNGAGKSTTLKLLTGYLTPSEGVARIGGLDVLEHRIEAAGRVGYLPENGPLYPEMTPLELLRFFGEARGLANDRLRDRIDAVVEECNLQAVLEKSIHKLSKGYRQRVGMAHALLHEPDILIMDEPTSGLDPNQIHDVRLLIRRLGETKTILISTHILQEVSAVCDHVILIHEGRVVFDGTPAEMAGGGSLEDAFHHLTRPAMAAGQPAAAPPAASAETPDLSGTAGETLAASTHSARAGDGQTGGASPDSADAASPDSPISEQPQQGRTTGGAL
jgi:ABC-2 type transport system ATP-binding protein